MRKDSKLNAIQQDAQRFAEAISSSLELETEIVDERLTIVAGTGRYRDKVGFQEEGGDSQAGYIYGRVVTRGKPEIVKDAPNDPKYDPSVHIGTTAELAEICCPIIARGEVLGVIGLVAFSETQREFLLKRKNQLVDFVHRMAELLASKAVETETLRNITIVSNQLRTIIESIDNGILAVDNRGTITHCNQIGANLIRRSRRDIIGERISKIWAGSPIIEVLRGGHGYNWREESYQAANHTMHFMVTVKPVVLESNIMGAVASFRDMADVRKKACDMIVSVQPVGIDDIWGESPQIRELRKTVLQVSQSKATVLITGETGTGKGLVASAIHHSGPRLAGPFIKDELTEDDKNRIVKDSIDNFNEHVNPGWLTYRKSVSTDAAFVEWEDSQETFRDTHGKEFIDCLGGFGIYTAGHRNPDIVAAVQAQLNRYALHSQELVDPLRGYLAKLVSMCTPGDLKYAFFCNGGAEANEMALKLARLASGNHYFISTVNGFHGKSLGAVSVTGKGTYRKPYLPIIQGVQHVEFGNAQAAEAAIKNLIAVGETVAAMIVEPIQGEAGIVPPPPDYLKQLREICDRHGVLLIFDEIQTGMGRTGTLWACEGYDVVPDILVFGKAFGGGVMPITGIIARPHLWVDELIDNPWVLGSPTFGGNPLACAAAIAAIKFMIENDIPSQIAQKGEYFMDKLRGLQQRHPILVDVRGKGLLIGLEYPTPEIGWAVSKGLFKRGVMTGGTLNNAKVNRIEPPGIISYETIGVIIARLDEILTDVAQEFSLNSGQSAPTAEN